MFRGVVAAGIALFACAPANAVTTLYTVSGTISGITTVGSTSATSGTSPVDIDLAGTTFDLTFNAGLYDDGDTSFPGYGPTYVDGSFEFMTRGLSENPFQLGTAGGYVFGQYRTLDMIGSFIIDKNSLKLSMFHRNTQNGSGSLRLTATRVGNQFVNWTGDVIGDFELQRADAYSSFTTARFEGIDVAVVVNGAPPIPEPATWALMIAGFGIVGVGVRAPRRARLASAV